MSKGVWSSSTKLLLSESGQNSGSNSLIFKVGGGRIQAPLVTIDQLVAELRLPRVDYIKMDIEGAEREALKGALGTLSKYRPRLMLDSYHRPDDSSVLPAIIGRAEETTSRFAGRASCRAMASSPT